MYRKLKDVAFDLGCNIDALQNFIQNNPNAKWHKKIGSSRMISDKHINELLYNSNKKYTFCQNVYFLLIDDDAFLNDKVANRIFNKSLVKTSRTKLTKDWWTRWENVELFSNDNIKAFKSSQNKYIEKYTLACCEFINNIDNNDLKKKEDWVIQTVYDCLDFMEEFEYI